MTGLLSLLVYAALFYLMSLQFSCPELIGAAKLNKQ